MHPLGCGLNQGQGQGPSIISGMGKATNLAHLQDRSEQKPIKNFVISRRGRTQGLSKIFTAPIYRANLAVIFAVAHLSCYCCDNVVFIKTFAW